MRKIICSPGSYIQGNDEIGQLALHYEKLGTKGAYLIVDKFILDTYGDTIKKIFNDMNSIHCSSFWRRMFNG